MMVCKRCQKEWDLEEMGIACPVCRATAAPDKEELAALFSRAVAAEQDKKYEDAFRRYALLSLAGSPEGIEGYARCYREGLGTPRDLVRAADLYIEAAEHGSVRAAYQLGRLLASRPRLSDGRGSPALWLRAAAALGSADAAYQLARRGERYGLTEGERLAYLDTAARAGHAPAVRRLSFAYLVGRGVEKNPAAALWIYHAMPRPRRLTAAILRLLCGSPERQEPPRLAGKQATALCALGEEAMRVGLPGTALRLFLLACEQGSVAAAVRVGAAYHEGLGTIPDLDIAIDFYRRAAECGSAEAALVLGRIFERERQNRTEAERWYRVAAEHGTAEHQYILGDFYLAGDQAGEGVRSAVPWLRKAASGGCTPAADRLSGIDAHLTETYNRAVAAQRAGNVREAFSLYENAAALGHAASLSNLGYCLQKGIGTPADPRAAARAYREAVAAGSEVARLNLAACYMSGNGIGRDFGRARALLAEVSDTYRENADALLSALLEKRKAKRAHRLYTNAAAVYHRGDVAGALLLRIEAAKQGSAKAAYMIGCHFEFGDGVDLDREKAKAWYEAAAAAGFTGEHARLKEGYLREKRYIDSLV